MRSVLERGNPIAIMSQMSKAARRAVEDMTKVGLAAGSGMDLILGGIGGLFVGIALAEKLNLPFVRAYLSPFTATREYSTSISIRHPKLIVGLLNQFSYRFPLQIMWQAFRSSDNIARRDVLGIPAAPFKGPFSSVCLQNTPLLYGFSPSVIPKPSDWDDRTHVTGYWFLDSAKTWSPPFELTEFLNSGPPPIYIGFGSMSNRKPEETADLVVRAMGMNNQRAVLFSGWGGLKKNELPKSILMIDSIPHAWLFPRVAAVIHHGGAGTTAAGLRAGVPSIIVPFFGDQPFWGRRIAELGVGPSPIPRQSLSIERLAQAIQIVMTDTEIRKRAGQLGTKIRMEDGVARAVEIIQDKYQHLIT